MAKKKTDFTGIVEESFNDGYNREPDVDFLSTSEQALDSRRENGRGAVSEDELKKMWDKKPKERTPEESKLLFELLSSEDETALNVIVEHEDRATYYITDVHGACIDILSHEEDKKKSDIVKEALDAYFSDKVKALGKDRVVKIAKKNLEIEAGKNK